MERKLVILLTILLAGSVTLAQAPKVKNLTTHDDHALHFGFNVGLNTMDFGFRQNLSDTARLNADLYQLQPGFHVSIVSNLRLGNYFDLRFLPGISFGQRDIEFLDFNADPIESSPQKISSSFIEFPLLLKYKAKRINNFRPYVIAGFNVRLDMSAKKDYSEEGENYIRLKPVDVYYELGFGFDSYLMYFKLSTELKLSIGLTDILVHDYNVSRPEFVTSIDKLYSRIVMLSFYFE